MPAGVSRRRGAGRRTGVTDDEHVRFIRMFADAGYDRVTVHQVRPDQQQSLRAYGETVLPLPA